MALSWLRAHKCGRVLLMTVALTAATAAAQSVTFQQTYQVGEQIQFDRQMNTQMNINITSQGQTLQNMSQKMTQRRLGVMQVLEVQNGTPSRIRVTYHPGTGGTMEANGQSQQVPFALAGQSLTASKGSMGELTIDHNGNLDDATTNEIKELLNPGPTLFPKRPLQVGEDFEADTQAMRTAFSLDPSSQVAARGRILAVRDAGGRQQAQVSITGTIQTKLEGALDMNLQLNGQGWFDVRTSEMVEGQIQAPMRISGQQQQTDQNGTPMMITFDGNGQLNLSQQATISTGGGLSMDPNQQPAGPPPTANPFGGGQTNNPAAASLAGQYSGDGMTLTLAPSGYGAYDGNIQMSGQQAQFSQLQLSANAPAAGKFMIGNNSFDFTLAVQGNGLVFQTGRSTYNLQRAQGQGQGNPNPFDQ